MDSKLILKNPDAAIEQHWGAIGNCSHYDAIVGKVQSINDTLLSTKKLKEQKELKLN